jgi:hypothetical protein
MSDNPALKDRPRAPWTLLVGVLALIGLALVLVVTRYGPGASGDSAYYVMGAQNIIEGNGFSRTSGGGEVKPITGFPPGFSAVLALLGLTGLDLFQVGRYLNAVLFGANIFIVGGLVYHYTKSIWPAGLAGLAILLASDMVYFHSWVMSEPLYIFLMLLGIMGILRYLEERSLVALIGTGLCVAAATLTRYIGAALLLAFALSILLLSVRKWLRRFADCVLLAVASLTPVLVWLRLNVAVSGSGVNRAVLYHPMRPELIRGFLSAASAWFVPASLGLPVLLRAGFALILAAIVPAIFIVHSLRSRPATEANVWRANNSLPWILILYIGCYLGILVVNSTFLDASTTLSAPPRYLLPAFVAMVMLIACVAFRLLEDVRAGRIAERIVGLAALVVIGLSLRATANLVRDPIPQIGYTGLKYTQPSIVARLEAIDPADPIISNNPELVFILIGKPAYMRPIQFDTYQQAYREDFEKQVADAQSKLDLGAVLVLFGPLDAEEEQVLHALDVRPTFQSSEATFYVSGNSAGG